MNNLKALGLPVTLNLHDASGVNNWDAMFPALVAYLGLPASSTVVPFNIVNATVAYAVEDIVLGDLLYNKSVAFWWYVTCDDVCNHTPRVVVPVRLHLLVAAAPKCIFAAFVVRVVNELRRTLCEVVSLHRFVCHFCLCFILLLAMAALS